MDDKEDVLTLTDTEASGFFDGPAGEFSGSGPIGGGPFGELSSGSSDEFSAGEFSGGGPINDGLFGELPSGEISGDGLFCGEFFASAFADDKYFDNWKPIDQETEAGLKQAAQGARIDVLSDTDDADGAGAAKGEADAQEAGDPNEGDPNESEVRKGPKPFDINDLSYEERIEHLKKTITRHPLQREINYKILAYCFERRTLPEVEDFIASCPEFPATVQSPYFLLQFLLKGGGIDTFEVDAEGNVVTAEQKEGLTEDEIDDLVAQFAYECNEFGREVAELMNPRKRLLELLEITPEYYDTFIEVLEYLTEKRSFADVDTLLRGRDVLMVGQALGDQPVQPSVFVDKLERAGGIVWSNGWVITREAIDVLETLLERRGQ